MRYTFLGTLCGPLALLLGCVMHPGGACGSHCATIDAATQISFPTHRLDVLKRVAQQPDLTQHEQLYLVNAIYSYGFNADKADALVLLIANPACTPQTRKAIAGRLKWVDMGKAEVQVVDALTRAERPTTAPVAGHATQH